MKNFEVAQVSGFWYQRGHSGATSLERLGAKPCSSSSGVTGRRSERVGTLLTLLQSMSAGGITRPAPPPPGMSRLPVMAAMRLMLMQV